MPTPGSVPEAENVAPLDAALTLPRPASPSDTDPVARLLHAAEALAHARIDFLIQRVGGFNYRLREVAFCRDCQRQYALNAVAHTESCVVGQVLAAVAAVREATAAHIADGWIAVTERLPEPRTYVLTAGGGMMGGISHPARVLKNQDGETEFWWAFNKRHVTHWRPLPDPPSVREGARKAEPCGPSTAGEVVASMEANHREVMAWCNTKKQEAAATLAAPIAEVIESDESWEAAEALHRCWPRGTDVDFASAPSTPERRVVCGRAIAVFGFPGLDTFTCDLERCHGDAWHHDRTVNKIWLAEATEIHFHLNGMVETRLMGRSPEFDYSAVTAVPR